MSKINMFIYNAIISELWLSGFEIKENVCGATTIMNGKEIDLTTWYSGFWADHKEEKELYSSFGECIKKLIKKAKEICPQKVIAVGRLEVDKTKHADYGDDYYYNVELTFGGY